jgi:iron complex outermembrane receptor protein
VGKGGVVRDPASARARVPRGFDQQTDLNGRISGGSTIRVGLSAQSYAFPAPTGIADFSLRKPGAEAIASIVAGYGPWQSKYAEADIQLPIDGARLGVSGGLSISRDGQPAGITPKEWSAGGLVRWAPKPGAEMLGFWSRGRQSDAEAQPLVFVNGAFLPKRFARNDFLGQKWADSAGTATNYGAIGKAQLAGFDLHLGIFRSVYDGEKAAADLLFDTGPDGSVGQRIVVLERDNKFASTSGEFRVSRSFEEGPRKHMLIASVRGRAQDRRYGGAALVDLGPSTSLTEDYRPEPNAVFGAKTKDRVRQTTLGLAYQGRWKDVGEVSIGVQKSRYSKRVTDPNPAVVFPESKDSPILFGATAAGYLTPKLALYAGYVRGLEESPVAPREAVNLNEAPPAIRTKQMDAGVRWSVLKNVTLVAGAFEVEKPYFNLDPGLRFRQLGMVRNRGLEFSVAGQFAPGLTVVAGNVLIDARVSGEEVDNGTIGRRPVGTFQRHTIVSVDYRLPFFPALSVDAFSESTSNRTANAANTLQIPARGIVNLGARYRFDLAGAPALVRAQVANVAGKFGWNNGGSGFFVPNGSRRFSLSLAADI